jgi:two-component system cell cycle sensor histidine kinase/response regulator CckA
LPTTIEIRQDIQIDSLVMADPIQNHQVMTNLCTNAEHAKREEGGVLRVKLADITLESDFMTDLTVLKPKAYLELTVCDSGLGIPAWDD